MVWLLAQRDPANFYTLRIIPRTQDRDLALDLLGNLPEGDVLE